MRDILDPDRLMFLDVNAAFTNMTRRCGWAPRSQRCRISVPQGHYKVTTAASRADGLRAVELADVANNSSQIRSRRGRCYMIGRNSSHPRGS